MSDERLLTDEVLDNLAFHAADPPVCRVCGHELGLADTKNMKYACTSDEASLVRNSGAAFDAALEHYRASMRYNPRPDAWTVALVAEVRRLRAQIGGQ